MGIASAGERRTLGLRDAHGTMAAARSSKVSIGIPETAVAGGSARFGAPAGNTESPLDTCMLTSLGSQPSMDTSLLALGPLRGLLTRYFLLPADSTVVDAGLPEDACTAFDQRGLARIGRCDVGAIEPSNPTVFTDGFEP